jgi:glycosyltransferase involved in cell wall biosynthesis
MSDKMEQQTTATTGDLIMRILFMHPEFPGQFMHLASFMAKDTNHKVAFITQQKHNHLSGVTKIIYSVPSQNPAAHPLLGTMEKSVIHSYAAANAARVLKNQGFIPDIVYGYTGGWSNSLFIKDVFPQTPFLSYFEWFVKSQGGEYNFDPAYPLTSDQEYAARISNMPNWVNLDSCSCGISPTEWQKSRFPREFQSKIQVVFDGIDTEYYKPDPQAVFAVPEKNTLSGDDEVLTYATRGMEPMRGFPQFMAAAALVQERRPNCHILVAGTDKTWYSKAAGENKTYKDLMMNTLSFDPSRLHFTGWLTPDEYRSLLQVSTAHVYLTRPYVLSWSAMEALSSGCLVIGSATPPVTEMIRVGYNGLLADFFSPQDIAGQVCEALEKRRDLQYLRQNARAEVCRKYSLNAVLPKQLELLEQVARGYRFGDSYSSDMNPKPNSM